MHLVTGAGSSSYCLADDFASIRIAGDRSDNGSSTTRWLMFGDGALEVDVRMRPIFPAKWRTKSLTVSRVATSGQQYSCCLSVCLSVCLRPLTWALQNGWTDRNAIRSADSGGSRSPKGRSNFREKWRPIVKFRALYRELCKNGCIDCDAVWDEDTGGPKVPCIWWGPDHTGMGTFEGCPSHKNHNCNSELCNNGWTLTVAQYTDRTLLHALSNIQV